VDDDEGGDESVDHVDFNVIYSCTLDEEVGFPIAIEKVTEEKNEDEDWCFVECSSWFEDVVYF